MEGNSLRSLQSMLEDAGVDLHLDKMESPLVRRPPPKGSDYNSARKNGWRPTRGRKVVEKRRLKLFNEHRDRIKKMGSRLDNSAPKTFEMKHLKSRLKKQQDRMRELEKIQHENHLLMQRMTGIMRRGNMYSEAPRRKLLGRHHKARQKELRRIELENEKLVQRLEAVPPFTTKKQLEQDWAKTKRKMETMCEYPLTITERKRKKKLRSPRSPHSPVSAVGGEGDVVEPVSPMSPPVNPLKGMPALKIFSPIGTAAGASRAVSPPAVRLKEEDDDGDSLGSHGIMEPDVSQQVSAVALEPNRPIAKNAGNRWNKRPNAVAIPVLACEINLPVALIENGKYENVYLKPCVVHMMLRERSRTVEISVSGQGCSENEKHTLVASLSDVFALVKGDTSRTYSTLVQYLWFRNSQLMLTAKRPRAMERLLDNARVVTFEEKEMDKAASTLQRHLRRHAASKKKSKQQDRAASVLQRNMRKRVEEKKKAEKKKESAARILQRKLRTYGSAKRQQTQEVEKRRQEQEQQQQQQHKAAVVLQRSIRKHSAVNKAKIKEHEEVDAAASVLQRNLKKQLKRRQQVKRDSAAAVLQRNIKNRARQRQQAKRNSAASVLQRNIKRRAEQRRRENQEAEQAKAARVLQDKLRRYSSARKQGKEQAAKKLQRTLRRRSEAKKKQNAAKVLHRNLKSFSEKKKQAKCATKLQSNFRRYSIQKEIAQKKASAEKLQCSFRGHQARKPLCERVASFGSNHFHVQLMRHAKEEMAVMISVEGESKPLQRIVFPGNGFPVTDQEEILEGLCSTWLVFREGDMKYSGAWFCVKHPNGTTYNGAAMQKSILISAASSKDQNEPILLKAWLVKKVVVVQVYNQTRQTSTWTELRTAEDAENFALELCPKAKAVVLQALSESKATLG